MPHTEVATPPFRMLFQVSYSTATATIVKFKKLDEIDTEEAVYGIYVL